MLPARRIILGAAATCFVVVIATIAITALIKANNAPPRFALSDTTRSGSSSTLAGMWRVALGSVVGYRAKEKFIDQHAETEAVARTSKVSGSLRVSVGSGTAQITRMKFTVDLASLTSEDKYATYQVYQRDFFVRTIYLETDRFPTATFTAGQVSIALPATGPVRVDIPGKLSVHGASKDVTAHVQAQGDGTQAEVAGSIDVDMRDFGIEPPDISFTRAEPLVTIEFDLKLVHA